MEETTKNGIIKAIVLMVLAAIFIMGIFLLLNGRGKKTDDIIEDKELTEVQKITSIDLERDYPNVPFKVAETYIRVMQVMYKQTYTDDEFNKMADVLAGIFDKEFLANQSNWPSNLKAEVDDKKKGDYSITKYNVASSDIQKTTDKGEQIANVLAKINLRHGTSTTTYDYLFVLRKDSEDHWKIMGWTISEAKVQE